MTLHKARAAREALKICVQENQDSVCAIEGLVREMKAMPVSARTHRTKIHDYFFLCLLLTVFHHLQAPGQIKTLSFSCLYTELFIVILSKY